ncbi:LPXTG cell wall anchor domain-containing protein [Enterococcus gallinarum]|nr:LPXTG cell wall anchor domain-containing protein [Enterococcus gallinarum]
MTPPSEPSGGETVLTTPTDPGTSTTETPGTTETAGSTTGSSTTEQPTTPSTSEEPEQPTKESTQPSEEQPTEESKEDKDTQPKEDKPAAPAKEVTVSVDPSGKITTGAAQGTSVPIVTSDVKEISHVPTPTTPLKAASGQTIVGVKDGVPLVQDTQGNLVEDPSIPVKKLPSGNIEVKTADGKTKVLPKTGEEVQAALSLLGALLTSVVGFFGYKKKYKG